MTRRCSASICDEPDEDDENDAREIKSDGARKEAPPRASTRSIATRRIAALW
jgi:hypothetical protein